MICPACGGAGRIGHEFDPSPPGVALGPGTLLDWLPCPVCGAGRDLTPKEHDVVMVGADGRRTYMGTFPDRASADAYRLDLENVQTGAPCAYDVVAADLEETRR